MYDLINNLNGTREKEQSIAVQNALRGWHPGLGPVCVVLLLPKKINSC